MYFSIAVVVVGSIFLGYMFGAIAMLINKMNNESIVKQAKIEDLDKRMRSCKIPKSLQEKVFEYFNFCWKKHLGNDMSRDFSDLSLPLQRDLLFYQHQELVLKVPLFKELEPLEVLAIIQKLK